MGLRKKEADSFFKLHKSLMLYVNNKKKLVEGISSISDLEKISLDDIAKLRRIVVNDPALIDSFLLEAPEKVVLDASFNKDFTLLRHILC